MIRSLTTLLQDAICGNYKDRIHSMGRPDGAVGGLLEVSRSVLVQFCLSSSSCSPELTDCSKSSRQGDKLPQADKVQH